MAKIERGTSSNPYQAEALWLRTFCRFHGSDGVTRFSVEDLNGVPLVKVMEALISGSVLVCEKCDGPGTKCVVEFRSDDGELIRLIVHLVSNEEILTICKATYVEESESEPNRAA